MDVIYVGQSIDLNWSIRRNASEVLEDFSRADLKVFLTGNDFDGNYDGKYYFANHIDEQGRVVLDIDPGSLTPGTYCIEGIWIKNSHELLNSGWTRSISRARKDRIFKVSDVESECTDYNEEAGHVVAESHEINIATGTTSYGYDGMSAYETAIFNGSTAKTEKEWIDTYEKAEDRVNYEMDESHDGSVPGEPQSWANAELKRKQAEGQLGSSDPYYSTSRKKKEEDRQTAESNRASAETSRGAAETQRQKNEGQLGSGDPDYATSRIKKENDRQTAESGRVIAENGRIMAENTRVQNEGSGGPSSAGYSTSRIKKELDRQSAESSRATAETSRQEYEGQGDYSDTTEYPNTRRAKEAARQTAETARATAETARQKAEGQLGDTDPDYATSRIKQEIDRQAAEAARELAETARENAKISSTTIEYAVGDSGTTPPSSGWQSTVPSYTTGDFLWGRTTITFGDGTSKVLYAIGSVPDVAVSQNASTGKTTITVGSDSYDVATEPVSVSQNTLSIGGNYAGEMSTTYDVTLHSGQTFASLSALLSDANLNTLIPLVVRKGGMSIKFVCSSDNKYVQFIYTSSSITVADFTNIDNWQQINIEELNYEIGSPKSVILDITSGDVYRDIMYKVEKGWPLKGTVYNSGSAATDVYIAFYDSSNNRIGSNVILYSLAPNTSQEFSAVPSDAIDMAYIRFTVTARTILNIEISAVKTNYLRDYINENIDYHESTLQPVSGNYILAFDNLSIKSGELFRLDITGSSEWSRLIVATDGAGINRIYDRSITTSKASLKLTASNNITKLFYYLSFSGQNSVNSHLYTGNALTTVDDIDALKSQSTELSNEIGQQKKQIQVTLPSGQPFTTGLIFNELNLHQGDIFYIKFSGDISATRLILRVNAVDGDNIIDYASADTYYKYVCVSDVQSIYYWINGDCNIIFDLRSGLYSEIINTNLELVEYTNNSVGAFTSHINDTLSAGNKVVRLFNGLNIKTNDKFYIKISGVSSARLILRANEGYNNTIQDYAKVNHLYYFTAQLDITSIWLWYNGDVNLDIELSIGEDKRLKDLIQSPLSHFPNYIVNNLGEKMLGCTTKGYLCITDDDGTSPAITYTLPMVQNKNIPFTFCICSTSEIMRDASARSTFINAVLAQNSKIHIAQHALYNWTENSEPELYEFFKNERDYFNSLGVEVNGAAIPSHYTSNLIQAVAGGLYKVVRASYITYNAQGVADNPPRSLYEWRPPVSSPRGNIYCLTSANILDYTLAQWKEIIDYAVTNKRLVNIYMHDFNFVERYPEDTSKPAIHTATAEEVAARKALLEGVIDYAKSVNIEIVSLGDVARLT